jgi:predicted TIM-barrel fold metal-dependent hydrolase
MHVDEMVLVSVDDHVIEPPHLFREHLPASLLPDAPQLIRREDGSDVWEFAGIQVPNVALNAVAGRPPEEYNFEPTSFDEIRVGTWNVHERVRDMSANGVLASMNFPSMPGFCGQLFMRAPDRSLGLRLLQAYNDWHILEWCGAYPGRFIPQAISPGWDPSAMAVEVRRVSALGCHSVTFSENPEKIGLPSFHSDHWDPFWTACSDEGTIVNLHIGSSSTLIQTSVEAPVDTTIALTPLNSALALGDLIFSRVLKEFPDLRIALNEGGFGWMPWFLERCDYVYEHHRAWTGQDFGGKIPSEVFAERFITCFVEDKTGIELRHRMNLDHVLWECDYPHSDSTWPHSPERLHSSLGALSDREINKITHLNAMAIYRFDPFASRPRERCTVGALRAEASDVDVSLRSTGPARSVATAASLAAAVQRMQVSK